jgi:hypothetical protein
MPPTRTAARSHSCSFGAWQAEAVNRCCRDLRNDVGTLRSAEYGGQSARVDISEAITKAFTESKSNDRATGYRLPDSEGGAHASSTGAGSDGMRESGRSSTNCTP